MLIPPVPQAAGRNRVSVVMSAVKNTMKIVR